MASLGQKIKAARKSARLTQAELADLTKISRSHIGAIEIDHYNPSLATLKLIANALKVPVSSFLDNSSTSEEYNYRLGNDESWLIDNFRTLGNKGKRLIIDMMEQISAANQQIAAQK